MKAFVGGSEEVVDYAIDNEYIIRGYRINHNTNGRSIKSIFVCHNETVNIWSHGLGVVFFLIILIATLIWIVPRQLAFGEELIERKYNYINLMNSELDVLNTLTDEVVSIDLSNEDNDTAYEQGLDRIMQTSEGIFLYAMTYLYNFDYLSDDVS